MNWGMGSSRLSNSHSWSGNHTYGGERKNNSDNDECGDGVRHVMLRWEGDSSGEAEVEVDDAVAAVQTLRCAPLGT